METTVKISCNDIILEGMWNFVSTEAAAVITHPHPLYGGDMHNPVVAAAAGAYRRKGISTLRFNFRGVGKSGGRHDDGRGEQRDLLAAIGWLKEHGINQIHVAGYSFGAYINALVIDSGAVVTDLVMISPPVAFIRFPAVLSLPSLSLIVTGAEDDIAPPLMIHKEMTKWTPGAQLKILPRADHFYQDGLSELESLIFKHLTTGKG
jgi:uncharacterized protein